MCVKSRTGYIMTLGGCPFHWVSKLQTEISLSTLESEYIDLSQDMRYLPTLRQFLQKVGTQLNMGFLSPTIIHSTLFEDNNCDLRLAVSPLKNSRTRHVAVKYHFFREKFG